ncbi:alginate export family protein [Flavobacterium rivuli]|nr:alginate export family protein [Flavobacterium rivuli]
MNTILKIALLQAYFSGKACRLLPATRNPVGCGFLMVALCACQFINGQEYPAFRPLRYDEDYTVLEKDTVRDLYDKVKYTKMGSNGYISFGGDFRTQYLIIHNENWSNATQDKDGYTLNRWLFHSDLHLSGNLRVFAELQGGQANSTEILVPVQENPLEPHQFFIDYTFSDALITLRAGRQEVTYGSGRVVSLRDGPNVRRSFDGVKAMYKKDNIAADAFYLHAVVDRTGIFDDTSSPNLRLWGAFSDIRLPGRKLNLNLYYLGFYNDRAVFNDGSGKETRHSLLARVFQNWQRWGYDVEGAYQFGSIGERTINAWSVALSTLYRFPEIKFSPEIGLKADLISGDKNRFDKSHQTFNPLFAPGAYFGLAVPLGPSNLMDIHPSVTVHFSRKITFVCDYAFLWRYSRGDGIYRPVMVPTFAPGDAASRYIGSQLSGTFICQPNRYVTLLAGMSWFDCGNYLEEVSPGENILYGFVSAQITL